MADALRAMGIEIEEGVGPDGTGEAWRVLPTGLRGPATVDVGNAGTVMRFLPRSPHWPTVPSVSTATRGRTSAR